MNNKEAIRIIWQLENKYNKGQCFSFWQDVKQALQKEIKDGEDNGIYYKAYNNLLDLKAELAK